jgi:hypothetical protein
MGPNDCVLLTTKLIFNPRRSVVCLCRLFRVHFLIVFRGYWVLPQRKAFPNDVRYFPHSLQADAGMLPQIRPRSLPATNFPIHYWWTGIPFDAIWTELLAESLKLPWRIKFSLSMALKAYEGNRGIASLILNLRTSVPRRFSPSPSPGNNPGTSIYRIWGWVGHLTIVLVVLVPCCCCR